MQSLGLSSNAEIGSRYYGGRRGRRHDNNRCRFSQTLYHSKYDANVFENSAEQGDYVLRKRRRFGCVKIATKRFFTSWHNIRLNVHASGRQILSKRPTSRPKREDDDAGCDKRRDDFRSLKPIGAELRVLSLAVEVSRLR